MDEEKIAATAALIGEKCAVSIGKLIAEMLGERAYKLTWMDNWPELFGELTKEEREAMPFAEVERIIFDRLLYGTGESTPRGILGRNTSIERDAVGE